MILIKGARVLDPSQGLDANMDILIDKDKIASVAPCIDGYNCSVIDATGLIAAPGLIDPHVHLRDPGPTHKEDILTGTAAAAAGGFTAVACMPNTIPTIDNTETIKYIKDKGGNASAKVHIVGCITVGQRGEQLCDYKMLKDAGVIAISDDGHPVKNYQMMRSAMKLAAEIGLPIISHCEDMEIIGKGIINKGSVSEALGVEGMDRASEDSVTAREIEIAEATNTSIHIAHVSTMGSVELIRRAKSRGVKVSGETAPHYFLYTDEKLLSRSALYRMNPPLRTEEDRQAIIQGICDGTLEVIATDHAPHTLEEKADFLKAPNGILGLQTSLPLCWTHLVKTGLITPLKLIELMSLNPAKLLNVEGGTLLEGSSADIVLFNEDSWVFEEEAIVSKSKNSPFVGERLDCTVKYTIKEGKITYRKQ